MREICYLSITAIAKIVHLCLLRPGTHLPNVPMPYVYPAPESHALNMQSKAMKAPMPDLITEITEFSCEALLITVVCIVHAALTVVKVGELHL